jgi:hypothetical protein
MCGTFDAMARCFDVPALEESLLAAGDEQRSAPAR